MTKKYYWLKLKRDFFKRHDIQIIEDLPNGKDYVLFYLKLLVESVDHDGNLRFNEMMPYNEDMLSTITHTNIDIVRSALKLLKSLDMIDVLDDDTIYMNGIQKLLGTETYWAEQKRKQRDKKELEVVHSPNNVQPKSNVSNQELETDIDKDIDIDKYIALFDNFWKAYPRKMSKGQAEKTFKKINPDEQLLKTIIAAIEKAKKTADWKKDNGQFIPYPSTWLNSKGWLDEIPEATNEKGFQERDYEESDIEDLYMDPLKEQLKEG